jgi:nicotinic acid phosphoribosyltransferase
MQRDGKVVFRPDTGDPVKVVVGNEDAEKDSPEYKGSIECLWEVFGGKVNDKGFKELDPHVGLIYGDSITLERAQQICEGLKRKGFASTNIVFGIGSFTYQYATRDTDGYAVKATFAKINGVDKEIFKSPKGASFKKSAKGLTAVYKDANGEFYLKDQATWDEFVSMRAVKSLLLLNPTMRILDVTPDGMPDRFTDEQQLTNQLNAMGIKRSRNEKGVSVYEEDTEVDVDLTVPVDIDSLSERSEVL